ncbi:MAG: OadG family protein, partial [Lachnospiraceae bacterium]|nr:OadG family protein [Lachnospiraceae bacterium]
IYLFKFIPKIQEKLSNRNKSNAEIAVDNAISQIEENEELVDDLELVAVITAAIAAASGASSDGFVVRSIRKAKRNR